MNIHVYKGIKKNCWNLIDSCGEICVHCGCCSSDPIKRVESRLRVSQSHLQEQFDFNDWSNNPKIRATQEKNQKSNIRHFHKQVRYYTKRMEELILKDNYEEQIDWDYKAHENPY